MGELGLLSVNVPEKWGGSGEDRLALAVAIEEIARGCGGTGAIMSIHNTLYVNLVERCGTDKQKEQFLRPFTCGVLGSFALSEPGLFITIVSNLLKLTFYNFFLICQMQEAMWEVFLQQQL